MISAKKKKVKKTIFIEQNKQSPIGGAFNDIHGHIKKPCPQDNSLFQQLQNWNEHPFQTSPPSIKVDQQYTKFPKGQIELYKNKENNEINQNKENDQYEFLEDQTEDLQRLYDLRRAAETHRQVRRYAQQIIKPNMPLIDICNKIEDMNRYLINEDGLKASIAFPTGCSINHVAAHYTPNTGDMTQLEQDDICKIDFGTQVNGRIIDCAFTVAFNPKFNKLLEGVKASTNEGIKQAGVDVRLCDIGAAIYEVMTSYEVEIDNKIYQLQPCKSLSGHSIADYIIHSGKQVPSFDNGNQTKMLANELYAIETFGSTGTGKIKEDMECSHYMRTDLNNAKFTHKNSKNLLTYIDKTFGRLAFCTKWLDQQEYKGNILPLKDLVNNKTVKAYPPLCEEKGKYVAQWEHTILIRPNCKEILSKGDDY